MKNKILLLSFMLLFGPVCSFSLKAQDSTTLKTFTWGGQVDFIATYPYAGFAQGVTLQVKRHKFQASVIFLKQANETSFYLWGPHLNYKYFAFKNRKHFNAYFFSSLNAGKMEKQFSVSRPDALIPFEVDNGAHLSLLKAITWVVGSGFEFSINKTLYLGAEIGIGITKNRIHEFDWYIDYNTGIAEKINEFETEPTLFMSEARLGLGFRF